MSIYAELHTFYREQKSYIVTMSSKLLQLINNIMKSSNETIKKVMEENSCLSNLHKVWEDESIPALH